MLQCYRKTPKVVQRSRMYWQGCLVILCRWIQTHGSGQLVLRMTHSIVNGAEPLRQQFGFWSTTCKASARSINTAKCAVCTVLKGHFRHLRCTYFLHRWLRNSRWQHSAVRVQVLCLKTEALYCAREQFHAFQAVLRHWHLKKQGLWSKFTSKETGRT